MKTFVCAQRGCEFEAETAPENCLVCNNPFIENDAATAEEEAPWTDYTIKELREHAEAWELEFNSRMSKPDLIVLLEAAEAEEDDGEED